MKNDDLLPISEKETAVTTGELGASENLDGTKRARGKVVIRQEEFSSPLLPPQLLLEYEKIHPGLTDRMMKMAEKRCDHEMFVEATNAKTNDFFVKRNGTLHLLGILSSMILPLAFLGAAVFLICKVEGWVGGAVMGGVLFYVLLVAIPTVVDRLRKRSELHKDEDTEKSEE